MNEDIFELLKELEIKRFTIAGYKDKHYMEIELSKDDLTRFETQYLQFYINKVDELRTINMQHRCSLMDQIDRNAVLEKALDKAIKKITLDNDEGFEFLDKQYEYWKEWCFEDD